MSQYASNITGTVLTDVRYYDGKIINFAYPSVRTYLKEPSRYSTNSPKFSAIHPVIDNATNSTNAFQVNTGLVGLSRFTYSAWVYIEEFPSVNNSYTINNANIVIQIRASANYLFQFILKTHFNKSTIGARSLITNLSGTTLASQNNTSINTSNKQWHHVAVTYNGSTCYAYLDGQRILTVNYTINSFTIQMLELYVFGQSTITDNKRIIVYLDDLVLIKDQVLWDNNFTVPNNYLTGTDKSLPKRPSKTSVIYDPKGNYTWYRYYEKVFLY